MLAPAAAPAHEHSRLAVNLALAGSASADGHAAPQAIDGSASTSWCSTNLRVDLGHVRRLSGLGLTLASGSATPAVRLDVSLDGRRWWPASRNVTPDGRRAGVRPAPSLGEARPLRPPDGARAGLRRRAARIRARRVHRRHGARRRHLVHAARGGGGQRFTDTDGRPAPVERILRNHGANYVRLRLWTNPPPGYNDLAVDLALARRIKAAGMKVYLDFHYSDFWADPQHQDTPAAWVGQDLPTLGADGARLHARRDRGVRRAGHAGRPGVDRQRDPATGSCGRPGRSSGASTSAGTASAPCSRRAWPGARAGNPRRHRLR